MNTTPATTAEHAMTLVKQVYDVADIVFRDVADALTEFQLTEAQATMLWALEPTTPPLPMRELARRLRCDPSNITLLCDQLQAAGLVERHPDPSDGRRRILVLTEKGHQAWSCILDRVRQRSPLFTLSLEEQKQLISLLEKVQANNTELPTGFLTRAS